jgi:serine/threonine protein kinase
VRLRAARALRYAAQVCAAMAYLHGRGVIHRDLKSANILLDRRAPPAGGATYGESADQSADECADPLDNVKVGDFGLSRVLATREASMTTGTGTFKWMAPELLLNKRYNGSVDVFSFGVVLYELCTGAVPYDDLTPMEAAVRVVSEALRPTLPPDVAPALAATMRACWAADAAARPPFADLAAALAELAAAEAAAPGRVQRAPPPACVLRAAAAAAAALAPCAEEGGSAAGGGGTPLRGGSGSGDAAADAQNEGASSANSTPPHTATAAPDGLLLRTLSSALLRDAAPHDAAVAADAAIAAAAAAACARDAAASAASFASPARAPATPQQRGAGRGFLASLCCAARGTGGSGSL